MTSFINDRGKSGASVVAGPASATDNAVARFDGTTGKLLQDSLFIVSDTGMVSSFGGNITFPATQAASADANTLDDYEEGTWTPVVGGNATYTAQVGRYTKIGRSVSLSYRLKINVLGTGSTTIMTGAPFTAASTAYSGGGVLYFVGIATASTYLAGYINPGTADIYHTNVTVAAVTADSASAVVWGNSADIYASFCHIV